MQVLKKRELDFLKAHELCRLATVSKGGQPHVTPVIYVVDGEDIVIAIGYGTRKLKNLRENPRLALVVDEYSPNEGVMIEGCCEKESKVLLPPLEKQVLYDRFEYYRRNPWNEGESPILKISPSKCVMW